MVINPYSEYRGAYGGAADDHVEQRDGMDGSFVRPWGSVNLIDELLVALMPLRRKVSFLLGDAVSFFILRGDSETECLLEEVVDGLDDDDPFYLELGRILLDETNSEWKAKSKVILNYKLKHMNKELGK
jgi:hypothetical protein